MAENFHTESLMLMIFAYITLIIIILRIALTFCQYTISNDTDSASPKNEPSLSLQEVIIVNRDEKKQNSNQKRLSSNGNHNNRIKKLPIYEKCQMISCNLSSKEEKRHAISEQTSLDSSSMTAKSRLKRTNDDDSFWIHTFQESELSMENPSIPHTSAYGMRKVGKKTYIDDTNIGSPGSKALEQKSCEYTETPKKSHHGR